MMSSRQRTYVAAEALSAGDAVYLSTTNKLTKLDTTVANIKKFVGVAATSGASGSDIAIRLGRVRLPASGTLNAGSRIKFGSGIAGTVDAYTSSDPADLCVGYAEETKETSGTNSGTVLAWLY